MIITKESITFSSGRKRSFNCGIVGISAKLEIHGGYDDCIHMEYHQNEEPDEYEGLSAEDIRELADLMIARWQEAKEKADILAPKPLSPA